MTFESFHFIRPLWLLGVLAIPLFVWIARRRGRSAGAWQRVCDPDLLPHLLVEDGAARRGWPLALLTAGWLAAMLALAGPTWETLPQAAYEEPTDTVAVLSLAPSMRDRDVAPSRLERARFELQDLLAQVEGTVGLVIYSDEAYAVTPLTDDPNVVRETIPILEPSLMPGRGARLDLALDEAVTLLGNADSRAGRIVVLTDEAGERPERAIDAAERARAAGYAVSVLSLTGDSPPLRGIADAGGGVFAKVRHDDRDVAAVLAAGAALPGDLSHLRQSHVQADVWRDMGAWLVLIPLALAPLAFRRGWVGALGLLCLLGAAPEPASASVRDWFARPDQQGAAAFESGDHAEAAARFEDPEWQAAAHYREGDYAAAIEALEAIDSPRAKYNLGNALARSGQLEEAIAAYDAALAAVPDDADARINREIVQQLLDQQKQDQQKQDQQKKEQNPEPDRPQQDGQDQAPDRAQSEQGPSDGESGSNAEQADSSDGESGSNAEQADSSDGESGSNAEQASASPSEAAQSGQSGDSGQSGAGEDASANAGEPANPGGASTPQHAEAGEAGPERAGAQGAGEPGDRPGEALADAGDQPGRDRAPVRDAGPDAGQTPPRAGSDAGTLAEQAPPTEPADRPGSASAPMSEREQAIEHMLRRVPDDPAGLLKEKLRRRYAEKKGLAYAGQGGRR